MSNSLFFLQRIAVLETHKRRHRKNLFSY